MLQISLREPVSLLILLMSGTMLLGQNPKPSPSESPKPNPSAKDEKSSEFGPPPPVVTEHSLTLPDGKTLIKPRFQSDIIKVKRSLEQPGDGSTRLKLVHIASSQ